MRFVTFACIYLFLPSIARGGFVASLDDIQYWVGSGANQAAFVIDWNTPSSGDVDTLAWGYRWDGSKTGEDMFRDIVSSDPRLYAKITTPGGFGISPIGIGYDLNNNGIFTLTDGTKFDASGILVSDPSDDADAVESGDLYEEGWFSEGFWAYYLGKGNPYSGGSWSSALSGMSGRMLENGSWDGWSYAAGFNGQEPSAAMAAIPEPSSLVLLGLASCVPLVGRVRGELVSRVRGNDK